MGKALLSIILAVALVLPLAWLRGFAICKLWGYFIVPAFHLSPLAIVTATGISLLTAVLTFQVNDHKYSEDPLMNSCSSAATNAAVSLISWFAGWAYLSVFS